MANPKVKFLDELIIDLQKIQKDHGNLIVGSGLEGPNGGILPVVQVHQASVKGLHWCIFVLTTLPNEACIMPIDVKSREQITVDGQLFRRAFADAFAKAVNNNPEGLIGEGQHDIAQFISKCCEWVYPMEALRAHVKATLGERSAAYRSIPDLFTKG